ncbi:MAG: GTPase HflX [Limnochordales bacterium]|nr:GTPase HflX [Limnochordales bacterium]
MPRQLYETADSQPQRAFLVGVELPTTRNSGWSAEESLAELAQLADTAGAIVVGRTIQRRAAPDPATYIGEGKAYEIEAERAVLDFDLVIFDDEISAVQQRNLEQIIGCAIIDRTTLILDIFARRARTYEAKLQVELAQLQYRLTRLAGKGVDLSRLGAGIGTRGPGETKLETDRRRIRDRISHLQAELREVAAHRERLRRERTGKIPVVALTGYTNAGKSTLHRALASSDVQVEDRLFATLDPTARRVDPPGGGEPFILVDTVGFIQKLPHQLVAAFRSTLEEVISADLILHVVDTAHPKMAEQMATVNHVLRELEAAQRSAGRNSDNSSAGYDSMPASRPQIIVFNKIDKLPDRELAEHLVKQHPGSVAVSALTGENLDHLLEAIDRALANRRQIIDVVVPYSASGWVAWLHERGQVLVEEHTAEGTRLRVELQTGLAHQVLARLRTAMKGKP